MRSIWKGSVSFGLVSIPVKLYTATGGHDLRFHQVHQEDGGRIRFKRVCEVCGKEVVYSDIAKGYDSDDGRSAILTNDDLDALPVASGREIDVVEFVPSEQVDPMLMDKTYYLEPDGKAAKPYALLREALGRTERMALVKVALRQRETLAVLRVRDQVIVLQTLLWPDEVREADFPVLQDDIDLRPQELTMAESLVESLAADFEPDRAPLAQIALALAGEGAWEVGPAPEPVEFDAGDALGFLSSNAATLAVAAIAATRLDVILAASHVVAALSYLALEGSPEAYADRCTGPGRTRDRSAAPTGCGTCSACWTPLRRAVASRTRSVCARSRRSTAPPWTRWSTCTRSWTSRSTPGRRTR